MNARFKWYDEAKTIMRYSMEGEWNWRDFHACVRASLFTLHNHPHLVDSFIDLSGSTRSHLPAGFATHVRTFGKKVAPALSGRAVVMGVPPEDELNLELAADRTLLNQTGGKIYFVDDEAGLKTVLAEK